MSGNITKTQVKINAPKVVKGREKDLEVKVQTAGLDTGVKEAVDTVTALLDAVILKNGKLNLSDKQKEEIKNNQAIQDAATQVSQNIAMAKIALQETNPDKIEPRFTSIVDKQASQLLKVIQEQVTPYGIKLNQIKDKKELVKGFKEKIVPPSPDLTKTTQKQIDYDGLKNELANHRSGHVGNIEQSLKLVPDNEVQQVEAKLEELTENLIKLEQGGSALGDTKAEKLSKTLEQVSSFFNEVQGLDVHQQKVKLDALKQSDAETATTIQALLLFKEKVITGAGVESNIKSLTDKIGAENKKVINLELQTLISDIRDLNHNVSNINDRESKANLAKLIAKYDAEIKNSSSEADRDTARNNLITNLEKATDINSRDIKGLADSYSEELTNLSKTEESGKAKDGEQPTGNENPIGDLLSEENINKAVKFGVPIGGALLLLTTFFKPAQGLVKLAFGSASTITNLGITVFREFSDHQERMARLDRDKEIMQTR